MPATALIKQITGHMGYCSCPRCDTFGQFGDREINATVYFQHFGNKRTDLSFRTQQQKEHHNGVSSLVQ